MISPIKLTCTVVFIGTVVVVVVVVVCIPHHFGNLVNKVRLSVRVLYI